MDPEHPERAEPVDILLGDALREPTRKERRALLGASAVGSTIVWTGLLPEKITALGIELSPKNRAQLLLVLAVVIAYFIVAFITYAASDIIAWHRSYVRLREGREWREARDRWEDEQAGRQRENVVIGIEAIPRLWWIRTLEHRLTMPTILIRVAFDFGVPLAAGLVGLVLILRAWARLPT